MDTQATQTAPDTSALTVEQLQAAIDERRAAEQKEKRERIDRFEKAKDVFVSFTAKDFQEKSKELEALKENTIKQANDLFIEMYAMHDKEVKDQKRFTLSSADDQFKVEVQRAEHFEFTEEASVHLNTIREIFKNKFEGRNKGFYEFLDTILLKGSKGEYDPKLLAKARLKAKALNDAELMEQFDLLQDCLKVVGSSMYCRCYARDNKGKWQNINVQFSSL